MLTPLHHAEPAASVAWRQSAITHAPLRAELDARTATVRACEEITTAVAQARDALHAGLPHRAVEALARVADRIVVPEGTTWDHVVALADAAVDLLTGADPVAYLGEEHATADSYDTAITQAMQQLGDALAEVA